MKKGLILLLVFALMSNTLAQYTCGGVDYEEEANRSGCSRHMPQNAEDTMLFMHQFIPDEYTPVKTIPLNINVWRNDDETGSWWQNNQSFRDSMNLVIGYLNWIYENNDTFSLIIPDAIFIPDVKVRFVIDTFYFYNNTNISSGVNNSVFTQHLLQYYPERLKILTYTYL